MLVRYDPCWPARFASFAAGLREAAGADWAIEHIGSTAIPGMRAKPIIDIAVRIPDLQDFDDRRTRLESAGWRRGSAVRSHPVMILDREGARVAIAHFFTAEEWDAVHQRVLRDWLRSHPEDADLYVHAKCDAVAAAARGTSAYNAAKTPVIQEIVDRARAAQGLPSVPVSDK